MKTKRISKHIDDLLLDPNNYRFIDHPDYKYIPDTQLANERVQLRTFNLTVGKHNEQVADLLASIKTNGFLEIDQIQVRKVGDRYLVLEGNRRVATLKYLYQEFLKGEDTGKLSGKEDFKIDLLEILGDDPVHHLLSMGLHHISGKKKWSALNEARLLWDLVHTYQMDETAVCSSLGISKQTLRRSMRTYSMIVQYQHSDFGDQFRTDMYSIFEAAVSTTAMKDWLGWDDAGYSAMNRSHLERFFHWISRTEAIEEGNTERRIVREPIITQYRQVKEVADFIGDELALKRMEDKRSISEGYTASDIVGAHKLQDALESVKVATKIIFNFHEHMKGEDYEEVNKVKLKLDALVRGNTAEVFINEKRAGRYFEHIAAHFTSLHIARYRKLQQVNVPYIKGVNIFAGGNNMGKTSMLEAFYLASQLNDINTYFDLEKYRGKFSGGLQPVWIDRNFMSDTQLSAAFNGTEVSLGITSEQTTEDIERTGYLSTLRVVATVGTAALESSAHLYANRAPELRYETAKVLCRSAFTSPYRYNGELLQDAHAAAVRDGYFERVQDFIRERMDASIEKIELVSEAGEQRFMVRTQKYESAIDLTKYGEGLQRVFEIALLLGYCRDGVLCIDEIDSAIHKGLLVSFTEFIQRVAKEFNVQLFVSTHSKECIDAFVENDFPDEDLMAYALVPDAEGGIACRFLSGNKLKQLVETIDIDIR